MRTAIEVENLRKTYRRLRGGTSVALDGLELAVPEGGVFGLLGPNGSGKTTTIRCLLGLARATGGSMRMLDRPVPDGLPDILRRTGAIVEFPALFPTLSGRENLRLLGALAGVARGRVDDALEEVGLAGRAGDPVRRYSLGMRQRLGLAAALLKDPALLILDEPANGLDPAGIREVRELLRRLGAEGRTVFVSSHLLAEVEQSCDSVAIMSRGRCVATGPVADVLAATVEAVLVTVDDLAAGAGALERAGFTVEPAGARLRVVGAVAADITRALAAERLWVTELTPEAQRLEELFLRLTAGLPDQHEEAMA
ncbi:MAG TPA: ABC transporter ATP-binding protein [Acidimicrobiia bacterium]|nr:ABC transporter ATP-binding protein [Acidimicrobiia bacterium]